MIRNPRIAAPVSRSAIAALLGLLAAAQPGCTGVEPAALGFGVKAAQRGVAFIDGVDTHAFELARYDDVVAAIDRAAAVLDIEEYSRREVRDRHIILRYRFLTRNRLIIEVRAETDTITLVRSEVSSNLRRGVSALFFQQVYHELIEADAYLEDWAGSSEDNRGLE